MGRLGDYESYVGRGDVADQVGGVDVRQSRPIPCEETGGQEGDVGRRDHVDVRAEQIGDGGVCCVQNPYIRNVGSEKIEECGVGAEAARNVGGREPAGTDIGRARDVEIHEGP